MSNVVSLFKGQVGLAETAMSAIQQVIVEATVASSTMIRDEMRPMRELIASVAAQQQESIEQQRALMEKLHEIAVRFESFLTESSGKSVERPPQPIAKGVKGLAPQKRGDEILAMLFDKMPSQAPSRLRPFYTDLEAETGMPITLTHKERVTGISRGEEGKYPYRKIDTTLMLLDPEFVFRFAKSYKFSLN